VSAADVGVVTVAGSLDPLACRRYLGPRRGKGTARTLHSFCQLGSRFGQHPPVACSCHCHRVSLAGDVGIRAADQAHTRRLPDLVPASWRVETPGYRPGCDRVRRRSFVRPGPEPLVRVSELPQEQRRDDPTGGSPGDPRPATSTCGSDCGRRRGAPFVAVELPVAAALADPVLWPTTLCLLLAIPMAANLGWKRGCFAEGPLGLMSLRLAWRQKRAATG